MPRGEKFHLSKVALVTGSSQGIGAAIALKLASQGFDIAINCRKKDDNNQAGEEVAKACRQFNVNAECFPCDVSDFQKSGQMIKQIKEKMGRIDVVVNNAGITDDGLIVRMKEEQFDRVINLNLKGAFNICRHVSAVMIKQKSGKIINVSSIAGLWGNAGQANYSASKAGLIGLTYTLAKELGSKNIIVNAVAPGFCESAMTEKLPEKVVANALNSIPLRRFGKVEEVASLVGFLSSDEANYINGQVISIDGGMML